jgi:hypothetical protein
MIALIGFALLAWLALAGAAQGLASLGEWLDRRCPPDKPPHKAPRKP